MLGIREFFCVGTGKQKESKKQKGFHRAILSIFEEGESWKNKHENGIIAE